MFPSLVNCCTIDWFEKWPTEALLSVSLSTLKDLGSEEICQSLSAICVTIHEVSLPVPPVRLSVCLSVLLLQLFAEC